jgi:hypothetical protein
MLWLDQVRYDAPPLPGIYLYPCDELPSPMQKKGTCQNPAPPAMPYYLTDIAEARTVPVRVDMPTSTTK